MLSFLLVPGYTSLLHLKTTDINFSTHTSTSNFSAWWSRKSNIFLFFKKLPPLLLQFTHRKAEHTFCCGWTISSFCHSEANLYLCACVVTYVRCIKGALRNLQFRLSEAPRRELIRELEMEKGSDTTGAQIMHDHYASINVKKHPWNRVWTRACRAALELENQTVSYVIMR